VSGHAINVGPIRRVSRPELSSLRREFRPMLRLALPVVVAELGWTAMATVDTLMVGRISAEAIGAVSLGSGVFLGVTIFGMGLLLGLDTLISQAYGAGRIVDCHRSLVHGIYAALFMAPPLAGVLVLVIRVLPGFGINPAVYELAVPYLRPVMWSLLPLLLYAAARRFLQATGHVTAVMVVLVVANGVNALTNWGLIFGKWGLPELGVVGAGWATFVSRVFMAAVLLGVIVYFEWKERRGLFETPLGIEWSRFRELFGLGLPAAFHITLEMGLFSVATALAGRLDAASLAAHQIALSVAATTFMVPLGVSSAGAVRVGHAMGRGDRDGVVHGGWMAIAFGVGFMFLAMLTLLVFPRQIIALFTTDAAVFAVGVSLLSVAALFQLFDGLQVVTAGVLRGLGDTRTPMVAGLLGYWILGLPTGYLLCFRYGWGVFGLWVGMLVGLLTVGLVLLAAWVRHLRSV
jgi:MATE family multidrug resistance protein